MNEKPCLNCTRVEDPSNCEIKTCGKWRYWWLAEWEKIRNYGKQMGIERGEGESDSRMADGGL